MAPHAGEGDWAGRADMPTARGGMSTSVVDGVVYAIGGSVQMRVQFFRTVEAYDPAKDAWTAKADMPTARTALSTSVVDGVIYAIGGDNGLDLSTVEAYGPATDTWV